MNKKIRTSRATSNTSNSNINMEIPKWSEESINEEEDIGMRNGRIKSSFENTIENVKGKRSKKEEIKIPKCSKKVTLKL